MGIGFFFISNIANQKLIVLSVWPATSQIFISLRFISKIEFPEIYQYALISMVILINFISMKIISIFSYFEKISVSDWISTANLAQEEK